jgi:hypothetical protein
MATKKIKLGDSSTWATMASLKDSKPCAASTTTAPTSTAAKGVIRYRPVPSLASPPRVLACTGAEEEDGMHDHRCRSRQEAGARRRAGNIRTVRRVTAHSAGETEVESGWERRRSTHPCAWGCVARGQGIADT